MTWNRKHQIEYVKQANLENACKLASVVEDAKLDVADRKVLERDVFVP